MAKNVKNFIEGLAIGLFIIAIVIGFFGFIAWSAYYTDVVECNQKWGDFERKQEGFYGRCLIKVDGKWIPSSAYREVAK